MDGFRIAWWVVVIIFYFLGVIAALDAIWKGRTSQGSVAWAVSLILFPYLAVPLYWMFGDRKFHGYLNARRSGDLKINDITHDLKDKLIQKDLISGNEHQDFRVLENLAKMPFTKYNRAEILINGDATFSAIFESIDQAQKYILVQFYKIHDDKLGTKLQTKLIKKAKEGIRVYLLYDDIGCTPLPRSYMEKLRDNGIQVHNFKSRKGWAHRLRLNFRNHRKIVVVDGKTAFVGGLNVSDKYMGIHPKYGYWRDTHLKIEGPSVQCVQLPFISDWFWATREVPELNWEPTYFADWKNNVLVLPSGPADELETCGIFFVHSINSAKKRLWISSPYFVPDQQVLCALQLAGLRGVDVRLMIPLKSDLFITNLSALSFLQEITKAGIKVYRYSKGFLHQKTMLIDDDRSMIGTANLDNRSFRINFEINILFSNQEFARKVEDMMLEDFANSFQITEEDYTKKPFWYKLAVKVARLLAPIQ
ncbi:MAG: cardiolipin synthase [Candidatus Cloacimonetes bacterium]|jgi:cardiolipin synthase|nr:cardiolipin synthase [Candidatus Cloacimonadota bacterium]